MLGTINPEILFLQQEDQIKAGLLDMKMILEITEDTYKMLGQGQIQNPPKVHLGIPEGTEWESFFNTMPSYIGGDLNIAGIKWAAESKKNAITPGIPYGIDISILSDPVTVLPFCIQDGTIITAHSSELLGCSAALLLNVTKHLAGIDHEVKLIPQSMIEPIQHTKISYLGGRNPRLHTDEVLVALSVLSVDDDNCRRALEQLPKLRGCQAHCTVMLSDVDQKIFKKLGVNLTCEPVLKK